MHTINAVKSLSALPVPEIESHSKWDFSETYIQKQVKMKDIKLNCLRTFL